MVSCMQRKGCSRENKMQKVHKAPQHDEAGKVKQQLLKGLEQVQKVMEQETQEVAMQMERRLVQKLVQKLVQMELVGLFHYSFLQTLDLTELQHKELVRQSMEKLILGWRWCRRW